MPADSARVLQVLQNPAYAGAYVYGRHRQDPLRRRTGAARSEQRLMDEHLRVTHGTTVTFERDFVDANRAAYLETCAEDDEIALRMDAGRLALMERGENQVGPYQSPMEDGMQHFHEWYQREMGPPGLQA